MEFEVRRTTVDDWREARELRLEMLADTPIAFTDTFERASTKNDQFWREYAAHGNSATGVRYVAITGAGRWIGTMGAYLPASSRPPVLVGVYVSPDVRGRANGVSDALFEAVEEWAGERADTLMLLVHEDNLRAQAAYRRRGFRLTGRSEPYDLDHTRRDLEMSKPLA